MNPRYEYIVTMDETGHYRLIQYDYDKGQYSKVVDKIPTNSMTRSYAIEFFMEKHKILCDNIYYSYN